MFFVFTVIDQISSIDIQNQNTLKLFRQISKLKISEKSHQIIHQTKWIDSKSNIAGDWSGAKSYKVIVKKLLQSNDKYDLENMTFMTTLRVVKFEM